MMALLFLLFAIAMISIWRGYRRLGICIALGNLALCIAMLLYHMTDKLNILL